MRRGHLTAGDGGSDPDIGGKTPDEIIEEYANEPGPAGSAADQVTDIFDTPISEDESRQREQQLLETLERWGAEAGVSEEELAHLRCS
jgi:hypothetical protein